MNTVLTECCHECGNPYPEHDLIRHDRMPYRTIDTPAGMPGAVCLTCDRDRAAGIHRCASCETAVPEDAVQWMIATPYCWPCVDGGQA